MAVRNLLLSCSVLCCLLSVAVSTRLTPDSRDLTARLAATGGTADCWQALLDLRACTGEVILFFLNGETYLGPACCRAIRVIEHNCWPSLLGVLGFTKEEGDVLRGYCDATVSDAPPPPAAPGPPNLPLDHGRRF